LLKEVHHDSLHKDSDKSSTALYSILPCLLSPRHTAWFMVDSHSTISYVTRFGSTFHGQYVLQADTTCKFGIIVSNRKDQSSDWSRKIAKNQRPFRYDFGYDKVVHFTSSPAHNI